MKKFMLPNAAILDMMSLDQIFDMCDRAIKAEAAQMRRTEETTGGVYHRGKFIPAAEREKLNQMRRARGMKEI